ncbi:hypothetical protein J6TS1_31980 [Siminovitchia terrae]|uniref:Uncharacterized protein n=1 Tax=Siminovitchia terrae TaxID=1914933 RepID=A0ABQ4KZ68_SIMTE|nr:hypothetical protein J6TS1_31980 [Siminovitchia terrae]
MNQKGYKAAKFMNNSADCFNAERRFIGHAPYSFLHFGMNLNIEFHIEEQSSFFFIYINL